MSPTEGRPSRHDLQKEGKHPAPCARFCEANAFQIELRYLRTRAEGADAAKLALRQFYLATMALLDSEGSPEACRKFDEAEAKVLAIIGVSKQPHET